MISEIDSKVHVLVVRTEGKFKRWICRFTELDGALGALRGAGLPLAMAPGWRDSINKDVAVLCGLHVSEQALQRSGFVPASVD